jgi:hypothetical protein
VRGVAAGARAGGPRVAAFALRPLEVDAPSPVRLDGTPRPCPARRATYGRSAERELRC